MNLGVGKVSDAARKAIEDAGGSIGPAASPELLLVQLPSGLRSTQTATGLLIALPEGPMLQFTRGWETKECRLDLKEEAANCFEKGKAIGQALAHSFPGTTLPTVCLALLGKLAADLIIDRRERDRYTDGVVSGFYEVNPSEATGVSI